MGATNSSISNNNDSSISNNNSDNDSNNNSSDNLDNVDNLVLNNLIQSLSDYKENADLLFLLIMGALVILMQTGFAVLEAGAVRAKNVTNIMAKNMVDVCFGGLAFWICGFAFAFGEGSSVIGYSNFAAFDLPKTRYAFLFFQATFAATCVTIVSGSIAERADFNGYIITSICITGFVYPVHTHWCWGPQGWLAQNGYKDFAGSGVVHLAGGTISLIGCYLMGPRKGRFEYGEDRPIPGHSFPMICIGYFVLLFGFLAFNGGSRGSITNPDDGATVSMVVIATLLSCCSGTVTVLFALKHITGKWKMISAINGGLTGMVSVCCGCDGFYPWAAVVAGVVAAFIYLFLSEMVIRAELDDPLDAIAVHLGGGMWGLVAGPLLRMDGVLMGNDVSFGGNMLLWNFVGIISIVTWNVISSLLIFGTLDWFGLLRVVEVDEIIGLDIALHDESAYPEWMERTWHEMKKKKRVQKNSVSPMDARWQEEE